jgi:hypothetical protein
MASYVAPLLFLVILFVVFGMTHHLSRKTGGCSGCTGTSCPGGEECSREDKARHR